MRPRRASASYGTVNRRVRLTSRETVLLVLIALAGLWVAASLVHQIALNHSLSQQASDLRQQNAALQSGSDGYRRDIAAVSSGAAAEEEARLNGYARGDEKVYVIASPSPGSGTTARPAAHKAPPNPLEWLWHLLTGGS